MRTGEALAAVDLMEEGSEATITLLRDIEYEDGIEVEGREITFDLNGFTLDVINADGPGLDVGEGGAVLLAENEAGGKFNVASSAAPGHAVYVHDDGQATVTSATATGLGSAAVYATGDSSSVSVTGDVSSSQNFAADAVNGAGITVGGDAEGLSGVEARGSGSSVKIAGDVRCSAYGAFGALARDGGSIEIDGDVSTSGDYCSGVNAVGSGSTVSIGGDVTVVGLEATGVHASDGGLAVIDGVLTAPELAYIVLAINPAEGDPVRVVKGTDDGVPAIGDYEGYLLYSDGVNFVYLTVDVEDSHTSSGGGSSGQSSSQTRYWAAISGDGSGQLPVTVNTGVGSASLNLGTLAGSLSNGQSTVVTVPSISGVNSYTAKLPASSLSVSGAGSLTLNTAAGSVTVPGNMLAGTNLTGEAGLTIGEGDISNLAGDVKAAIGDRPVIQLTLTVNGVPTDWNNPDAPVTVSIPYTPTVAELNNPEGIVVWYIDGSGNAVSVPNGRYDPATGTVTFSATHFSDYAVVYRQVGFGDVAAGAWYCKAVNFIAAREITSGTGGGNFSPDAKLTRGQFLVMLMRAYDIAPDANPASNFSDAGSTYYTGYLAAAKRLGISSGIGNNMFAPEKEITRQEMFTLLYNALKIMGRLPQGDSGKTLYQFTDAGQDLWAQDAMVYLVGAGVISGNNSLLTPTATTRAEMAQILYNLLSSNYGL